MTNGELVRGMMGAAVSGMTDAELADLTAAQLVDDMCFRMAEAGAGQLTEAQKIYLQSRFGRACLEWFDQVHKGGNENDRE